MSQQTDNQTSPRTIYSVGELSGLLKGLVEDSLPRIWVEGEISNFSRPASGHWYFTLKDSKAQLRCAMFKGANYLVRPQPQNGDQVLVRASVSFYLARGDLQLICEHLESAGEGALLREYEALKRKLASEGLFESSLKRPIPKVPRCIGLITSATGAAIQDICAVVSRRFPLTPIDLWPVPVQGDAAAPAIVQALDHFSKKSSADVILLARGGGSLEDLWAFNEESVARAVRRCALPVVCGVGHEIDTSIADLAADVRAATPTAAAELLTPDGPSMVRRSEEYAQRLRQSMERELERCELARKQLRNRLDRSHPQRLLNDRAQRLDDYSIRLAQISRRQLSEQGSRLDHLCARMRAMHPGKQLGEAGSRLARLRANLERAATQALQDRAANLRQQQALLQSLNPSAILERGYSIAISDQGLAIRDADSIEQGEAFDLILARSKLRARREG